MAYRCLEDPPDRLTPEKIAVFWQTFIGVLRITAVVGELTGETLARGA
jgi:hypothetical protein